MEAEGFCWKVEEDAWEACLPEQFDPAFAEETGVHFTEKVGKDQLRLLLDGRLEPKETDDHGNCNRLQ